MRRWRRQKLFRPSDLNEAGADMAVGVGANGKAVSNERAPPRRMLSL
jgi:hypothetical protein